ncbi:terpene synthase family protein [Streptomyces sp. NPDC001858]
MTAWARRHLAAAHAHPAPGLPLEPTASGEWVLAPDRATVDRVEAEVRGWALGSGLYDRRRAAAMAQGPCTQLAATVAPNAPEPLLRALSMYWTMIIAFDDQVVEAGRPAAPYRAAVGPILLAGRLPEAPDHYHRAFLDVREAVLALPGGAAALPEFTSYVLDALDGYVHEWEWARAGRLPRFTEYLADGVGSSHILPGIVLQRLEPGRGLLPPGEPLPPALAELARLACLVPRLENDLLSFAKDERDGALNACRVLAQEYGGTPHGAAPAVLATLTALRARHDALLTALDDDGPHGAQARAIGQWADACYAWFLSVARYGTEARRKPEKQK